MRVREALVDGERRLASAGVASPRHDAEVLMSQTLKLPRGRIDLTLELDPAANRVFTGLVAKRCQRIPLQHITGVAPFRYLSLRVGEGVFIPRPETELVVEAVIREVRRLARPTSVLDLGAGSGAIALAIATECAEVDVTAVEVSSDARAWLEKNLALHQSQISEHGSSVKVIEADFTEPLESWLPGQTGQFDIVVSNPPYVPSQARIRDAEVADFDPPVALFGGADGLDAVKAVIAVASIALRSGGMLVIEHGDEQGADAQSRGVPYWVKQENRFVEVNDRPDLNSRPRFTTAVLK